jgi:hypothetical protein
MANASDQNSLSQLAMPANVPAALAGLIADLLDLLPEQRAQQIRSEIAPRLQPDVDFSAVAPCFLLWLFTHKTHGLLSIARRPDVRDAIGNVCAVLKCKSLGIDAPDSLVQVAQLNAGITQAQTWNAYRRQEHTGYANRIEWMAAAAASEALSPSMTPYLTSALHGAAVAWMTVVKDQSGFAVAHFYHAAADQLLQLIMHAAFFSPTRKDVMEQLQKGDRVTFDDAQEGPQTGIVVGIIDDEGAPVTAVIEVDHALEGVTWNVPLSNVTRLESVTA